MDYYDKAVAYLTERPELIHDAWNHPCARIGGALFQEAKHRNGVCACLTQIRLKFDGGFLYDGPPDALISEIRRDERIPDNGRLIGIGVLPVFAEWQRRIDAELGRTTPVWVEPGETP